MSNSPQKKRKWVIKSRYVVNIKMAIRNEMSGLGELFAISLHCSRSVIVGLCYGFCIQLFFDSGRAKGNE